MADVDVWIQENINFGESPEGDGRAIVSETVTFTESVTFRRVDWVGTYDGLNLPLPTLSASGGPWPDQATCEVTLPSPTISTETVCGYTGGTYDPDTEEMTAMLYSGWDFLGEGHADEDGWSEWTILPMFELDLTLVAGMVASGELDLPPPTCEATGIAGDVGTLEVELPALEGYDGYIVGGDYYTGNVLPMPTLEAEGYDGEVGSLSLDLPCPTLSATGLTEHAGDLAVTLPMLRLSATTQSGPVGVLEAQLPVFTLHAHGAGGAVGEAEVELPSLELSATGIVTGLQGTASLTLPMFLIEAEGTTEQPLALPTNVVVMNLSNFAISEYANFPFSGFFILDGNLYGTTAQGIYLIDGTSDSGVAIETEIEKTGIDLGSLLLKRATDVFMKFRATGDLLFEMIADKKTSSKILNNGIEGLRTQKIEPGKGMKGRHLGFNLKNIQGATLRLNEIVMIVDILKRRAHDE